MPVLLAPMLLYLCHLQEVGASRTKAKSQLNLGPKSDLQRKGPLQLP